MHVVVPNLGVFDSSECVLAVAHSRARPRMNPMLQIECHHASPPPVHACSTIVSRSLWAQLRRVSNCVQLWTQPGGWCVIWTKRQKLDRRSRDRKWRDHSFRAGTGVALAALSHSQYALTAVRCCWMICTNLGLIEINTRIVCLFKKSYAKLHYSPFC